MALSEKRVGQIAVLVLKHKLLRDGAHVSPKGAVQEVIKGAKVLDIPVSDCAKFLKLGLDHLFAETAKALDNLAKKPAK